MDHFWAVGDTDWLFEKETISRPRVLALLGNQSRLTETRDIKAKSILGRFGTSK